MPIQGLQTFFAYISALILGIVASLASLLVPMKEEVPQLFQKPVPTPVLTEQTRELSREEQATMSASFIKEFEMMMSSGSGERK